jgi:predicted  nucleic acid-binding Zn-ribbon protein
MSDAFTIKEQQGPPPKPTREELEAALARYERRRPAQEQRVQDAVAAERRASRTLDDAKAELVAANEAKGRLETIIADLRRQIGA